jgi:hypothetical protein
MTDCNLIKYPSRKLIRTSKFSRSESPFIFSNRMTYTVGKSENPQIFENKFYVSEISNYPESEVIIEESEKFCGEKSSTKLIYFKKYFTGQILYSI